ncbi:unnamed protein product, partial [Ixodes persulcatus]
KALKPGSNCSYIVLKTVCKHESPQHSRFECRVPVLPTMVGSLELASSTLETKTLFKAQKKSKK